MATPAPAKAPQAAAPKPAASAAPGAKEEKAKKEKKAKRIAYPGLKDAEGKDTLLEALPTDFDAKLHKPLQKKNFKNEAAFWLMKAAAAEKAVARFKQNAIDCEKTGGLADKGKAKKLLAMQARAAELQKELEAELGVDVVAAMLATKA